MSGFIFIIVIDWVMRKTFDKTRSQHGNLTTVLEDVDYANDITLLASRCSNIQEMTIRLNDIGKAVSGS